MATRSAAAGSLVLGERRGPTEGSNSAGEPASQRARMAGRAEVAVVEDTAAVGAPTATAATPPPDVAAPAAAGAGGEEGMRMEGWLYLIRSNRFGLQYSRKRYFVLEDAALRCFKSAPSSKREVTHASRLVVAVGFSSALRWRGIALVFPRISGWDPGRLSVPWTQSLDRL